MNFDLLRPVVFAELKVGDKLVSPEGRGATVTYIAPNFAVLRFTDNTEGAPFDGYLERTFRLHPLCWVEGKPVYPGDTLYYKDDPTWKHNEEGVIASGIRGDELHFHGGIAFPIDIATWTKPQLKRVPSFQVEGVDVFPGDAVYYYGTNRDAWGQAHRVKPHGCVDHIDGQWPVNSFIGGPRVFRLKPQLVIGDQLVPMPEREAPDIGDTYFTSNAHAKDYYTMYSWGDSWLDQAWLERGLIHLTKEAAIAHGKALIALSKKEN